MYYQLHDLATLTEPKRDSCLQNNQYLVNKYCLKSRSIFCLFKTCNCGDACQKVVELVNSSSFQKMSSSTYQFYAVNEFQDGILYPVIYNRGSSYTFKSMRCNYSQYRKVFSKSYTYNPSKNVIEIVSKPYFLAVQDEFVELSTLDQIDFAELVELIDTKLQEIADLLHSIT